MLYCCLWSCVSNNHISVIFKGKVKVQVQQSLTAGNCSPNDTASHVRRLESLLIRSYEIFCNVNQAAFLDNMAMAHCEFIKQTFDLCS
jgi:hypothetical protein